MSKKIDITLKERYDLNITGFNDLLALQHAVVQCAADCSLSLNMSKIEYISPAFAAAFGALPLCYKNRELNTYSNAEFKYVIKKSNASLQFFANHGILAYYFEKLKDYDKIKSKFQPDKDAIAFQEVKDEDGAVVTIQEILNHAPVILDESAKNELISNIYEMFDNSLSHSLNKSGIYVCGFWGNSELDKNATNIGDVFVFSVYDTGVGICKNVNDYLRQKGEATLADNFALEWAFIDGNSTADSEYPRGLGLCRLEEFIKLNDGEMFLVSNQAFYSFTNGVRRFELLAGEFFGTLFTVCIKTDRNSIYVGE